MEPLEKKYQDSVALRKLTLKAKPGFAPYPIETVEYIISIKKFDYLRLLYYKNSQITFTDDILDILGILPEKRILKPGINKELAKPFENPLKNVPHVKGANARISMKKTLERKENFNLSKGALKARNQKR